MQVRHFRGITVIPFPDFNGVKTLAKSKAEVELEWMIVSSSFKK